MKSMGEGQCPFGFGAEAAKSTDANYSERHMGMAKSLSRDSLPELVREPIAPDTGAHRTGRCLCGKVSFRINQPVEMVFANHDEPSRRRSGGVSLTLMIRAKNTTFNGWGHLVHYPLSDRETSCFCRACGSPVLSYYLAPEPVAGMARISAGMLDHTDGLKLAGDISADTKPDFYNFEGERRSISSAELAQMFG